MDWLRFRTELRRLVLAKDAPSYRELEKMTGIDKSTITRWVNVRNPSEQLPDLTRVLRLLDALQADQGEFFARVYGFRRTDTDVVNDQRDIDNPPNYSSKAAPYVRLGRPVSTVGGGGGGGGDLDDDPHEQRLRDVLIRIGAFISALGISGGGGGTDTRTAEPTPTHPPTVLRPREGPTKSHKRRA